MTNATDDVLVRRARQGDAAAFATLVERHGRAVYRAVLAALANTAEAEEVAQDTWVTIHQRLESFRGEASFRTWSLAIAWRKALDHRRRLRRWMRMITPDVEAVGGGPGAARATRHGREHMLPGGSPEQALLDAEQEAVVRTLIRSLPRRLRDPLLLAGTREMTYEEIAAVLHMPVGTLKWRISEARRILREKLSRLGY